MIRAEILKVGTIKKNDDGGWDMNGWRFGPYPLVPWVDEARGLMAGWPFEFLEEICKTIGTGRSLEQCFFCGAPMLPDEVPWDVFVSDLLQKLYNRPGDRVGTKIGKRAICKECYADLRGIIVEVVQTERS